jgi:hypothetical protein
MGTTALKHSRYCDAPTDAQQKTHVPHGRFDMYERKLNATV